ncbi:MAG: hypothetical protein OXC62_06365 [Aestuariivita sp.]|nr:hypothetical protein [Aestuariivita sp.]
MKTVSIACLTDAIRNSLDDPSRMAEIVATLNNNLDPSDLIFVKNLLEFFDAAARVARTRSGEAPGTTARILHDTMHQIRWRVGHYFKNRAKVGIKGLGSGVLHEWSRYYAWMDEDAFAEHIVGSPRPLTKKDLYTLTSHHELSSAASKLADHSDEVTV